MSEGEVNSESSSAAGKRPRMPDRVADVLVVGAVIIAAALPGPFAFRTDVIVEWAGPAATSASAVLLILRRRAHILVLVATVVLFCLTAVNGSPALGVGVAATVAAFGVADRTTRRTGMLAGGAAAALLTLLSLVGDGDATLDPRVFQIAAAVAIATALGDSARSRREYVEAMTERAQRAERTREAEARRRVAEERLRIAQDLHDTVAHRISVISLNAGVASNALHTRPERALEALGTIRNSAREVLSEIGVLLRYLRDEEDLSSRQDTSGPALTEIDPLVRRVCASGFDVDLRIDGDLRRATGTSGAVAYRVIQEGLTNAQKHGAGDSARLDLVVRSDRLRIQVANPVLPGRHDPGDAPSERLGLVGIRERVASAGGDVEARRTNGTYELTATLPLRATEAR